MAIELRDDVSEVDWDKATEIITRVLIERNPEDLKRAFCNSSYTSFVYDEGELIAIGRAMTDHVFQAALYDICVLPEYQGQGIGKMMVASLVDKIGSDKTIVLFSVPGKEGFYERLGFEIMVTAMGRFKDHEDVRSKGYLKSRS